MCTDATINLELTVSRWNIRAKLLPTFGCFQSTCRSREANYQFPVVSPAVYLTLFAISINTVYRRQRWHDATIEGAGDKSYSGVGVGVAQGPNDQPVYSR